MGFKTNKKADADKTTTAAGVQDQAAANTKPNQKGIKPMITQPPKSVQEKAQKARESVEKQGHKEEGSGIIDYHDIDEFYDTDEEPLDFLWQNGPLAGTVAALIAPGGVGKSFFALEAALAIAAKDCEKTDLLNIKPSKSGVVDYYAFEDPKIVLHHRFKSIVSHFPPESRQEIKKNFRIRLMLGQNFDFATQPDLVDLIIESSKDSRLIVFDTISRAHSYDENSNNEMSFLLKQLERIAQNSKRIAEETGATVLFLHHTSKGAATEGRGAEQQAARGASAMIDNARWSGFVQSMTEKEAGEYFDDHDLNPIWERRKYYLKFGVSKQNYAFKEDQFWLQRLDGGVLKHVDLERVSVTQQKENLKGRNRKLTKKELSNDENW